MSRECTLCRPDERMKCNHNPFSDKTTLQPYIKTRKMAADPNDKTPDAHCGVCHKDFRKGEDIKM